MTRSAALEPQEPAAPSAGGRAKVLTVRGATVLGIGSMIGAGIFALLGEAGAVGGAAVWISFLVGGIVAGLLGYVCAKLRMRFPSPGGLISYLIESFGKGRLVGVTCWLGYIAATSAVVLIVANLVDLLAITSVGSAVLLVVFPFVGLASWRAAPTRTATRSSWALPSW